MGFYKKFVSTFPPLEHSLDYVFAVSIYIVWFTVSHSQLKSSEYLIYALPQFDLAYLMTFHLYFDCIRFENYTSLYFEFLNFLFILIYFFIKTRAVYNKAFKLGKVPCKGEGVSIATTVLDWEADHLVIIQGACSYFEIQKSKF